MKFAISGGHEATTNTAFDVLKAGGNAFDAAIAAFMVSFVAEPFMSSAGAGAFANVFTASGKAKVYDFFCQTPKYKRSINEVEFYPVEVDFGEEKEYFHIGRGSTAVPGSIAGIYALHEQLGTIPMKELAQAAIQYAKEGIPVNNFQRLDMELLENIARATPETRAMFCRDDQLLNIGEKMYMPQLADFLEYMSHEGKNAFYQGEVAQSLVADHQANGGFLTLEDLKNYQVIIRDPLQLPYRDKTVLTNPLPSTGGSILVLALAYLSKLDLAKDPMGSDFVLHLHQAFQKVEQGGKLPQELQVRLQQLYKELKNNQASEKRGSTSHFNIIDKWNNAISLTMTIGEGSATYIKGTDIHLNNMLGEAPLMPNGFHSWLPNIRLSSMMAPTIVLNNEGKPEIILGSGGSSRIPSAILQVLHYLIDYGFSLEDAINAPRLHLSKETLFMENGFQFNEKKTSISQELKRFKGTSLFFGGVHTILSRQNDLFAKGDERRDGVALS